MENIRQLILKHLHGTSSPAEDDLLKQWAASSESNQQLLNELNDPEQLSKHFELLDAVDEELAWAKIRQRQKPLLLKRNTRVIRTWMWRAAAILAMVAGGYLWQHHSSIKQTEANNVANVQQDIPPGADGAVLTLADGSQVVLDSLSNGIIANQTGTEIRLVNGHLAYHNLQTTSETAHNTLTTQKGRQFKIILPDGTQVWLNADSELRYPTSFQGAYRLVEVKGEAYFEVTPNHSQPFKVKMNGGSEVEVLGTAFNINAYDNELNIKATLIEGAVLIRNTVSTKRLKPGQQAAISRSLPSGSGHGGQYSAEIAVNSNPDIEKVIAWKNGYFDFNKSSLADVMRQLERWYDVEVKYEKGVPTIEFFGEMSRGLKLSEVVKILHASNVKVKVVDKTLIISE